ncbi:RDD family protein [Nonomuraea sp. NPDC048826]|uniref:RDD family protein n=1 Tax=Nonomuraea sp. NPDC048826 TaxID=3364347 RepID=UPI0037236C5A
MPPLPRLSLAAWSAAALVALVPTWWAWEERLAPEGLPYIVGLVRPYPRFSGTPVLTPLLTHLGAVATAAVTWALPAVLVLAGFVGRLRQANPEAAARRVAWGLVTLAAVRSVSADFTILVLSPEWFADVAGQWGPDQLCYLLAATLVLLAPPGRPSHPAPALQPLGLRAAALAADYAIFLVAWGLVDLLLDGRYRPRSGLLFSWPGLRLEDLALVALLFLYVWIPRGTTPGKRLLGLRVEGAGPGKAALRALLFPVAVLWPTYGLLWLALDVLWSFVDKEGHLLHDRLLDTSVRCSTSRMT